MSERAFPKVGIIVPTADPSRYPAHRCLETARATTAHLGATIHPIVSSGPEFRFSRSINRGIREAGDADAWVLLNDDAFMDPGWLEAMVEASRSKVARVGLVGAVLRREDGSVQHAGAYIPTRPLEFLATATRHKAPFWALRTLREHRFRPWPYMFAHYDSVSPRHRLDFLTGAALLITRELHDAIGGIDEDYVFSGEDADYGMRALEAGFELCLATRASGIHLDRATGNVMSEKARQSVALLRERWPAERIERATRRGGRCGVYA